jgi:hypothetical protein
MKEEKQWRFIDYGIKAPENANCEYSWVEILDALCTKVSPERYTASDERGTRYIELHDRCVSVTQNGKTTVYFDRLSLLRVISYRVYYLEEESTRSPQRLYIPLGSTPAYLWELLRRIELGFTVFGIAFCYTHELEGFIVESSRHSSGIQGPLYSVSQIPIDCGE